MQNWDEFWKVNNYEPINGITCPESWSDVSWKILLEEWYELYSSIKPGGKILECGCGTATLSQFMAMNGFSCVGIDSSKVILDRLKNKISQQKNQIELIHGDVYGMPFENDYFDFVYSGGVVEYLSDISSAIGEMRRVLKPGGILSLNVVPKKFSIQLIGNIESTVVKSIYNFMIFNYKDILKYRNMIDKNYPIINRNLNDYERILEAENFTKISCKSTTHFPSFTLPKTIQKMYIDFLVRNIHKLKKMNVNDWPFKKFSGITYTIYATK